MTTTTSPQRLRAARSASLHHPVATHEHGDPLTSEPCAPPTPPPVPLKTRLINLTAILLPFAGLITAMVTLWEGPFSLFHLLLFLTGYLLTAVGVTVGYHRYFTHRSFQTNRVVQIVLGVLGSMAVEGPIIPWVATHRRHHQHSDQPGDPHSPHTHGDSLLGTLQGMLHAHCGWLLSRQTAPDIQKHAPDLLKDPVIVWLSRLFPLWAAMGLLLPAAIGWAWSGGWTGALLGLLWGGLVRVFFVHHVTWSVNSICHIWGRQRFHSRDHSRNNFLVGVLALGEGWHNNHHAFPASAKHGMRWWEIDLSYLLIRALVLLGLAREVRQPTPQRLQRKRKHRRSD